MILGGRSISFGDGSLSGENSLSGLSGWRWKTPIFLVDGTLKKRFVETFCSLNVSGHYFDEKKQNTLDMEEKKTKLSHCSKFLFALTKGL